MKVEGFPRSSTAEPTVACGFAWFEALPVLTSPVPNESIASLTLRLDRVNRSPAGTVLRLVAQHGSGISGLTAPGALLAASTFDLEALARLSAIPLDRLISATAKGLTRSIYGVGEIWSRTLGARRCHAICPRCCVLERIPLL